MRRALSVLLLPSVIDCSRRPKCVNRHKECEVWAKVGECDANPLYMRESCALACDSCAALYTQTDALGYEINLYGPFWNDHDRDTFANNRRINSDQPPTVPAFTETGFKKVRIPEASYSKLLEERAALLAKPGGLYQEGCTRGYLNNCGGYVSATWVMPVSETTKRLVGAETRLVLEDWIGPNWGGLAPTAVYGIRRYTNGSTLQAHVRRPGSRGTLMLSLQLFARHLPESPSVLEGLSRREMIARPRMS